MQLRTIVEGFCLLWPETFDDRLRATQQHEMRGADLPLYVVDLDAPLEGYFCAKQEHKLRELTPQEAEEHTKPTPIENITALALLRDFAGGLFEPPKPVEVNAILGERGDAASAWIDDGGAGVIRPPSNPEPPRSKRGEPKPVASAAKE